MTNTKHLQRLVVAGIVICVALTLLSAVAIDSANHDKRRAHKQCKDIAMAVEAYTPSSASPGSIEEMRRWGQLTLKDLARPPHGGPSLLRNGDADLIDPWGKPFQLQLHHDEDGRIVSVLVSTTAPDGTPISQHGIGPDAAPKPE